MRFLFALVLAASTAFAGDAVDDALQNLGADDPALRDAAEKFLWRADGSAYDRAKSALDATTDAEVRVRLTPIVKWLLVELESAPLEAIWADRWFLMKERGRVSGVEHTQRFNFKGEEKVRVAGKDLLARHYVGNPEPGGDPVESWLSDDDGVVKAKTNGLEGEASTETDAKGEAGK